MSDKNNNKIKNDTTVNSHNNNNNNKRPRKSIEEIKAEARAFAFSSSTSNTTTTTMKNTTNKSGGSSKNSGINNNSSSTSTSKYNNYYNSKKKQPRYSATSTTTGTGTNHRYTTNTTTGASHTSFVTSALLKQASQKHIAATATATTTMMTTAAATNRLSIEHHNNTTTDPFHRMISTALPTTATSTASAASGPSQKPLSSSHFFNHSYTTRSMAPDDSEPPPPPQLHTQPPPFVVVNTIRIPNDNNNTTTIAASDEQELPPLLPPPVLDGDFLDINNDDDDDDDDDEGEEFLLDFDDDEDDDEDEEEDDEDDALVDDNGNDQNDTKHPIVLPLLPQSPPLVDKNDDTDDFDTVSASNNSCFYRELEEELGWLEEEDIEAAVATLLDYPMSTSTSSGDGINNDNGNYQPPLLGDDHDDGNDGDQNDDGNEGNDYDELESQRKGIPVGGHDSNHLLNDDDGNNINDEPSEPFNNHHFHHQQHPYRSAITPEQEEQLRTLLQKHHQLLLQQAVLAVRAANAHHRQRSGSYTTTTTTTSGRSPPSLPPSSSTTISSPSRRTTGVGGGGGGEDRGGYPPNGSVKWGGSSPNITATTTNNGNSTNNQLPYSEFAFCSETSDDIAEILDSAVGMLLDLDENRKDAIRYQIQCDSSLLSSSAASFAVTDMNDTVRTAGHQNHPQLASSSSTTTTELVSPQQLLYAEFFREHAPPTTTTSSTSGNRRLTRAQFSKQLLEQSVSYDKVKTVFNVRGLHKLMATFNLIDRCVEGVQTGENNLLEIETNKYACEQVLRFSDASIDQNLIPGCRDVSENFVDAKEIFDSSFEPPCNPTQDSILRKNRNFFTAGEDNLVLRGVNLYGEKQWVLIADRFLPERTINIISQRYSKLSYMLFKANEIKIDQNGNLPNPPKLDSVDDLNEEQLLSLPTVQPPAILNVHRWSMEEDLTLLKAVALMGSMWAEVRARYIPHRDRGHLRKRYQVLERRIKATAGRIKKHEKMMVSKIRSPVVTLPQPSPHYAMNVHAASQSQFPMYHAGLTANDAGPTSLRSFESTTHNGIAQSSTTVKNTNLSVQARDNQSFDPMLQKLEVPINVNAKQENQQPAPPPHPVPPPYYHHPHPYMYHPPPPGSYVPYLPTPYGYYPPYYHPGQGYYDDGSRAGYEQLIADPSRGWSQMPHMKSMLESEAEVASTIITQLAKSPSKPPLVSENAKEPAQDKSNTVGRGSIIDSAKTIKSPSQRTDSFVDIKHENENESQGTPTHHSPGQPYPYYVSPAIQMPDPSPGMQPSVFSPDCNFKLDDSRLGSYLQGSPTFPYTHLESNQNSHSLNGYDLGRPFHNTDSVVRDIASDTQSNMFNDSPDASRLVFDGAHLLDTDLEAVSALNLLKSPAKSLAGPQRESQRLSIRKKSLFATVVGNLNDSKAKTESKSKKVCK